MQQKTKDKHLNENYQISKNELLNKNFSGIVIHVLISNRLRIIQFSCQKCQNVLGYPDLCEKWLF